MAAERAQVTAWTSQGRRGGSPDRLTRSHERRGCAAGPQTPARNDQGDDTEQDHAGGGAHADDVVVKDLLVVRSSVTTVLFIGPPRVIT